MTFGVSLVCAMLLGKRFFARMDVKILAPVIMLFEPCHEIMALLTSVNSFFKRACAVIQWG